MKTLSNKARMNVIKAYAKIMTNPVQVKDSAGAYVGACRDEGVFYNPSSLHSYAANISEYIRRKNSMSREARFEVLHLLQHIRIS